MGSKRAREKVLFQGRFARFVERDDWEFIERTNCTDIVIIVALTEKNEVLFTEQYRTPVKKKVVEFPAGLVNDIFHSGHETVEGAALRELEEETGYRARKVVPLVRGPVNSGLSSDVVRFYRALGLRKVSSGGGDATEKITVHKVPLRRAAAWLAKMARSGRWVDPKVYAGLYFLTLSAKRYPLSAIKQSGPRFSTRRRKARSRSHR